MPDPNPNLGDLLAQGGGNATAAGVSFQARLGAALAAQALAGRALDSHFALTNATIRSLRFETEAPLDDVLAGTTGDGFIFVQAKTSLNLSTAPDSELGKTAEQIVRQWIACETGGGQHTWDRPLSTGRDALVVAVGPAASGRIRQDLAAALVDLRRPPVPSEVVPQNQSQALADFSEALKAGWQRVTGNVASAGEVERVLPFIHVMTLDMEGPDRSVAIEVLRGCLLNAGDAEAAFSTLAVICEGHMSARSGDDTPGFRRALAAAGIRLLAPPDYRADVEVLRRASEQTRDVLGAHERISFSDQSVAINRQCTTSASTALQSDSLLLIGEPGAGKSALLNSVANTLRQAGHPVVELAADRLPVQGLDGLRSELGLSHPVGEVLANWPGIEPALLVIDALDATRGGASEAVFRQLISDVLGHPSRRWRVLASIRTFDLSLGRQFKSLFPGTPPEPSCADPRFQTVRHISVPPWTDEELAELLRRAPSLDAALVAGGPRVRDLARVPFNTRLVAELISGGLPPEELRSLGSQADLLQLYWEHRVLYHGAGAEICLRAIVTEMIERRGLRATAQTGSQAQPAAFEALLGAAVIVTQDGGRHVAFRHHILFDYAASRLYINPHDVSALRVVLDRDNGLGLLLAPAIAYALRELWASSARARAAYWSTLATVLSDQASDPIARSVAARSACELPRTTADIEGLLPVLSQPCAGTVLSQILGALAVRFEDSTAATPLQSWTRLADAAASVHGLEESVRFLLWLLTKHADALQHRDILGRASRQLLQAAFTRTEAEYRPHLTVAAIEFVASTYSSDPGGSRALLERVFEAARFGLHAHQEVPWLANKIELIAEVDPQFATAIYRETFARSVSSTAATPMGSSQILPMTSNARQDYEMARHHLEKFFPRFLAEHPAAAVEALIGALEGYVAGEHPFPDAKAWAINLPDGSTVSLKEDRSCIWAWDPESSHPEGAEHLVKGFVAHLKQAAGPEAAELMERIIPRNALALVWARTLMVASLRPGVFDALFWPIATRAPMILCEDTRKDALDFIAAAYASRTTEERAAFERSLQGLDWFAFSDPGLAREHTLARVFGRIGAELLVTEEARQCLATRGPDEGPSNERPYSFSCTSGRPERWRWLRSAGVDVEDARNVRLLEHAERVESALGLSHGAQSRIDDMRAAVDQLRELEAAMDQAARDGVALDVLRVPGDVIARGCGALAVAPLDRIPVDDPICADAMEMAVRLAAHRHPEATPEQEEQFDRASMWSSPAPRIDAARTVMQFCRRQPLPPPTLLRAVESLIRDPHPAVRMTVAQDVVALWNSDRALMWRLAQVVVDAETNRSVLQAFLTNVLGNLRNADPERVERLVLDLRDRLAQDVRTDEPRQKTRESIGSLVGLLWIVNVRSQARRVIDEWCAEPLGHSAELDGVLAIVRGALILGLESAAPSDEAIRRRAHESVSLVVDAAAGGLESFYGASDDARAGLAGGARTAAMLVDRACNELYFASGAFRGSDQEEDRGLRTDGQKQAFLAEAEPTLRRIGDVGTPHTVHHLLELLEFLAPSDPAWVFDLIAHALLEGGRRQGYQFESLGAGVFVRLVGVYLADHRELFVDELRRRRLIECLDIFIQAGWPAARRLLYQLPELLR